jgi:hypothetical protein
MEENVVNIRKKYKPEFKRVLSDEGRVNKIFTADKNFRDILRKELQSRKGNDNQNNQNKQKGNRRD